MKQKTHKILLLSFVVLGSLLTLVSYIFFRIYENINYYILILEFVIAFGVAALIYSIYRYKEFNFYKLLNIGYFLLFISYFVDFIDQIFIHTVIYTVVMEKITLIVGGFFVYWSSNGWMSKYLKISQTDELTQLPNRAYIKELINDEAELSKVEPSKFCLAILDIDLFKGLNDDYGHYFGDLVLSEFSNLLQERIRPNDAVGRWGGEEFVMILRGISKEEAVKNVENLRSIIEDHSFKIEEKIINLTVSIGVSEFESTEYNFQKLFTHADDALYKAKNSGRNKVMY